MRCVACDKQLSDFESTRKYAESNEYLDLCNHCLSTIPDMPELVERADLWEQLEIEFEEEEVNSGDNT